LSTAQVAHHLTAYQNAAWLPNTYGSEYGWKTYPVTFQGHELRAHVQPAATPQNIRRVEWSPNHLRAWRKAAYWAAGGHNPELPVIDDHDLIVRMVLSGLTFKHIPECLYFYRVHGGNTVARDNALIQRLTQDVYDRNITALAERFACDGERRIPKPTKREPNRVSVSKGLKLIDLCGAIDTAPGYEPLDISLGPNLDKKWPLEDDSVGVIRAHDAIEHLKDPVHTMNEAYRVLAPGGFFMIRVPSTTGPMIRTPAMDGGDFHWVASAARGAFQDPTHVSFWNENSFWYYTKASHARYLAGLKARFQAIRLRTFYPDEFCQQYAIPYVEAHLIALKDGYEPMGIVEI
jgi:SAM-dependent methyltransferase